MNASAQACSCSNCSECSEKVNDPSCNEIHLNANISNHSGTCIGRSSNFSNKIFDCSRNMIEGDYTESDEGVYLYEVQNNTLRNCAISGFYYGIHLQGSSNNTIINNTINSNNDSGIYSHSSSNNTIRDNIVNSNRYYGMYIYYYSNNNTIANNTARFNTYGIYIDDQASYNALVNNNATDNDNIGIYFHPAANYNDMWGNFVCGNGFEDGYDVDDQDSNAGGAFDDNNTCDRTNGWNDYNGTPCTHPCPMAQSASCGCSNGTYNYTCGQFVMDSCTLNCDLNSTSTCFKAGASNIVIDGNGHTITGAGSRIGVSVNKENGITIRNFRISNFAEGIYLEHSSNDIVTNNTANLNYYGIALYNSSNSMIANNTANLNTGDIDSAGIYLEASSNNTITRNTLTSNYHGIIVYSSLNNITNNTIANSTNDGMYFTDASGNNSVSGNSICYNANYDIENDASGNFGSGNYCDTTDGTFGWNDTVTGLTNCTYPCSQSSSVETFNISLSQGWNLISIPLNLPE